MCGNVLDHAPTTVLPECGGHRPHLTVPIRLEDLQNRARAGCLAFAGTLTPQALRMLACDAAAVPIVLGGTGQPPLDVGRGHPHHPRRAAPRRRRPRPRLRAPGV